MANYTTADIKALRELTGAGMMDVKKALDEAEGDRDKALELIRLTGIKAAAKREDRSASAGLIVSKVAETEAGQVGIMVQVNSETDFVAKNAKFMAFADEILNAAVASGATNVEELLAAPLSSATVRERVEGMAGVIGEKIEVSSCVRLAGDKVAAYLHRSNPDLPPQVGVLVATDNNAGEVASGIAMHIAAYRPDYLTREDVPAEVVAKERGTLEELTRSEGKPEKAVPHIVEGRLNAFFKEICLLDQAYARDPKSSVGEVVKATGGSVTGFVRIRVGA